jgi:serine/threonine protein kinase
VTKSDFEVMNAIGRGGFGLVKTVESKRTKEMFAMKEMSKARVIAKKSVQSVMNEHRLLTQVKSP